MPDLYPCSVRFWIIKNEVFIHRITILVFATSCSYQSLSSLPLALYPLYVPLIPQVAQNSTLLSIAEVQSNLGIPSNFSPCPINNLFSVPQQSDEATGFKILVSRYAVHVQSTPHIEYYTEMLNLSRTPITNCKREI